VICIDFLVDFWLNFQERWRFRGFLCESSAAWKLVGRHGVGGSECIMRECVREGGSVFQKL
jgi:hypothetical protein